MLKWPVTQITGLKGVIKKIAGNLSFVKDNCNLPQQIATRIEKGIMSKYEFTAEMGEISGFGDIYEDQCRAMVIRGAEWFDENPNADPQFTTNKSVYGLINEHNADANNLTNAMIETCKKVGYEPTGAMMQTCVNHVLYIKKYGWDKYVALMIERNNEQIDEKNKQAIESAKAFAKAFSKNFE